MAKKWERERLEQAFEDSLKSFAQASMGGKSMNRDDFVRITKGGPEEEYLRAIDNSDSDGLVRVGIFNQSGQSVGTQYNGPRNNPSSILAQIAERRLRPVYNLANHHIELYNGSNQLVERITIDGVIVGRKDGIPVFMDEEQAIQVVPKPAQVNQASSANELKAWSAMMDSLNAIIAVTRTVENYDPSREEGDKCWSLEELTRITEQMRDSLHTMAGKVAETPESIGLPLYTVFVGLANSARLLSEVASTRQKHLSRADHMLPDDEKPF